MGRDSVLGTATRYRVDGPGIESRWGDEFSAVVQTDPGAHPTSYTMGKGKGKGEGHRKTDHEGPGGE